MSTGSATPMTHTSNTFLAHMKQQNDALTQSMRQIKISQQQVREQSQQQSQLAHQTMSAAVSQDIMTETMRTQSMITREQPIELDFNPIPVLKLSKKDTNVLNAVRDEKLEFDLSSVTAYLKQQNIEDIKSLTFTIRNKDKHVCATIVLEGDDMFTQHIVALPLHAVSNKYTLFVYLNDLDKTSKLNIAIIKNIVGKTAEKLAKSKDEESYMNTMELSKVVVKYTG